MKSIGDKEIQELAEKGMPGNVENSGDVMAYQSLFAELGKKPLEGPSYGFSRKVVAAVQARLDKRIALKWYLWVGLLIIASLICIYLYLSVADPDGASIYASALYRYKWPALFGSGCFFLIEYLDRKFVKT